MRRMYAIIITVVIIASLSLAGSFGSFAEGTTTPWYEGGGTASMEPSPEDGMDAVLAAEESEDGEPAQVVALYRTNILNAQNGLGTGRYTLAMPTDAPLDENDPTMAALAILVRRIIQLDGSLGDPADATLYDDITATKDIGASDVYAILSDSQSLHIYLNGENILSEGLNPHFPKITYTRNLRDQLSLRYTRADGKTALFVFNPGSVVLFTGEYENLTIDYNMTDVPVVLGAGCLIEQFHVNSRILIHNSGLIEDSDYCPQGIDMIGIAVDEEQNPILIDSGMWSTGPRPTRGRICTVCRKEYNGKVESQYELHLIHVCEWADCKNGGLWASCAKDGSLYDPALHGPAAWCPYGLCAACSDTRCAPCQRDIARGIDRKNN